MKSRFVFEKRSYDELKPLVLEHMQSLAYPLDSFLEDKFFECTLHAVLADVEPCGYIGETFGTIYFYYIMPKFYRYAPKIFEDFITESGFDKLFLFTQDHLFSSIVMEWDIEIKKEACFFVDTGLNEIWSERLKTAAQEDIPLIIEKTGDFFDKFEERVADETIFMMFDKNELLGCGITEMSRFFPKTASIGMIVCKEHRGCGIAKKILFALKEKLAEDGIEAVAGCWFYNTLSRKSLESAGMIAASKGLSIKLLGKERLTERSGNPPGEEAH